MPPSQSPDNQKSTFLQLPRELRRLIYQHLLPLGKCIYPDTPYLRRTLKYVASTGGHYSYSHESCHLAILRVNKKIGCEASEMLYRKRKYIGVIDHHGIRLLPCWTHPQTCSECENGYLSDYNDRFHHCPSNYGGPKWDYFRLNFDFGRFGSLSFNVTLHLSGLEGGPRGYVGFCIRSDRRYERRLRKLAKILSRAATTPGLSLHFEIMYNVAYLDREERRPHSLRKLGASMLRNVENICSRVGMMMTPLKHFDIQKTFKVVLEHDTNHDFTKWKNRLESRLHALYGGTDIEPHGPDAKIVYDEAWYMLPPESPQEEGQVHEIACIKDESSWAIPKPRVVHTENAKRRRYLEEMRLAKDRKKKWI